MKTFQNIFSDYIRVHLRTKADLSFWESFLKMSIEKYQQENPDNRWIRQTGFGIYDIPATSDAGTLKMTADISTIEIKDLPHHQAAFFNSIMNLSIVRIYNALELLLLQAIHLQYFPVLEDPMKGKKQLNALITAIITSLREEALNTDTRNNRYLLEFIAHKSPIYQLFLNRLPRIDKKSSWKDFFEFASMYRHVIIHNGMVATKDQKNELQSIGKDYIKMSFQFIKETDSSYYVSPKDEQGFSNFIHLLDDFAGNTVKFIAEEQSLAFLGFS